MGIFDGSIAEQDIQDYVNQSDAILNIGAKLTDSATAGFSYQFDINDVIMLNHNEFKINDTCIEAFSLPNILNGLNKYIHYKILMISHNMRDHKHIIMNLVISH